MEKFKTKIALQFLLGRLDFLEASPNKEIAKSRDFLTCWLAYLLVILGLTQFLVFKQFRVRSYWLGII